MGLVDFESIYPKYENLVRATLRHYGVREADLDDLATRLPFKQPSVVPMRPA